MKWTRGPVSPRDATLCWPGSAPPSTWAVSRWVSLSCEHENGAISDVVMSGVMQLPQSVFRIEAYSEDDVVEFDGVAAAGESPWAAARAAFAAAVRRGRAGELNVVRGLALQGVIERSLVALGVRGSGRGATGGRTMS